MHYVALATDYDGTLATEGRVDAATLAALERLRGSGRKLIMVTGRELDDLMGVFSRLDLFDLVVAENGALLYRPATGEEVLLGAKPPAAFIEMLRRKNVARLSVGRVIVATWEPHEAEVLEAIRTLGLELQIIFNKGAVMVLPAGINKASGLAAALDELSLSPHNVVGVGDAENDHAFLDLCGRSVAVGNALLSVKEQADLVTEGLRGAGVGELIDRMLKLDLVDLPPRKGREGILLGRCDGRDMRLPPFGRNVLVAGGSGGESTLAAAFLERLADQGYQFCAVDPDGGYGHPGHAILLGERAQPPSLDEIMEILDKPERNAVVNMLGVAPADRPAFFAELLPRLLALRARTGRPHWIAVGEAHRLLPAAWPPAAATPQALEGLCLITTHPEEVAPAALASIDIAIAVGQAPERAVDAVCRAAGLERPIVPEGGLEPGQALVWDREDGEGPRLCRYAATPSAARSASACPAKR